MNENDNTPINEDQKPINEEESLDLLREQKDLVQFKERQSEEQSSLFQKKRDLNIQILLFILPAYTGITIYMIPKTSIQRLFSILLENKILLLLENKILLLLLLLLLLLSLLLAVSLYIKNFLRVFKSRSEISIEKETVFPKPEDIGPYNKNLNKYIKAGLEIKFNNLDTRLKNGDERIGYANNSLKYIVLISIIYIIILITIKIITW